MATLTSEALQGLVTQIGVETGIPACATANVLTRPIDLYHSCLASLVTDLVGCDLAAAYDAIQRTSVIGNGDLTVVIPRLKLPDTNPKDLAAELVRRFPAHKLFVLPVKDGVNVRVFFSPRSLPRLLLPYIHDRKESYGKDPSLHLRDPASPESGRKKVIVEFSSPNIATEFTTAHLRSTILGAYIANIHEAMGWEVVRVNYLGDWGKNIGLLGLGWQRHGSEEEFEKDPLRHLHEIDNKMEELIRPEREATKNRGEGHHAPPATEELPLTAERDAFFKNMEDGDREATEVCKKFREVTISHLTKIYSRLGVRFDEYSGESQINPETQTEVESILREKGICEEEGEGATVIDFDKHGAKLGKGYVRKAGSTTYLLRDIAAVFDRFKTHSFDKMLYVVSGEQDSHFRQVFKAIELMGRSDIVDRLQHLSFGAVRGLSAQLGNAKLLDNILDECERQAREALQAEPDQDQSKDSDYVGGSAGITALVTQELSLKNSHATNFESSRMVSPQGETGLALHHCYARLCSAIAKSGTDPIPEDITGIDYTAVYEEPWCDVLRLMAHYPDAVASAYKTLEPGTLLSFLFRLVEELSSCLDEVDESDEEGKLSNNLARAIFYENVRQVLDNGFKLLGIPLTKK